MNGFTTAGPRPLPPVQIDDTTKARLTRILAAMLLGYTPQEILGFTIAGYPDDVEERVAIEAEKIEIEDHLSVLLDQQQSPAPIPGDAG